MRHLRSLNFQRTGTAAWHLALALVVNTGLACDAPAPVERVPSRPIAAPPAQPATAIPRSVASDAPDPAGPVSASASAPIVPALPDSTRRAQQHRREGRLGMARAAFEAGWQAHESPAVALIIGVLYQRAGAHLAALRWLARAEIDGLSDFVAFRTLRSAAALGDVATALLAAESIPARSRFAPHARTQAAAVLLERGRPLDAARWLESQLTKAAVANSPEALALMARAWATASRPAEAIRLWRRVALRAGEGALRTQAERAARRLRWSLPRAQWQALEPDPDAHVLAGLADLDAHAYADAEARMLAALRDGIDEPTIECDTWWILARARSRSRDHAAAAPTYARFVDACADDPRAPRARFAEARAWFSADDAQAAVRAARSLWRRWPDHRLADDARLLAARVHMARSAPAEALDHVQALLWHTPDGDVAADAAWLARQLGGEPPDVRASDRAHVGRIAYFEGVDRLTAGDAAGGAYALQRAWRQSPSGYYGLLARLRLARAGLPLGPPPDIEDAPPGRLADGWQQGKALLSLGFVQDAWWAFDHLGPGDLEDGRYAAQVAELFDAHGHPAMAMRMLGRDVPHLDGHVLNIATQPWFDAVYPTEHVDVFEKWAEHHQVPVALVLALAHTESRFNPRARSWAGACGIMQLVPSTAADLARREGIRGRMSCRRLRNVALSVRLATRYLADLKEKFGDHPGVLAAAYNAGPGNVERWVQPPRVAFDVWVEQIPFHQARRYVKRVLAAMAIYAVRRTGVLPDIALD